MGKSKNNQYSSSTLQALLDIEKSIILANDNNLNNLLMNVVSARKEYEKNRKLMKSADDIFDSHRYPDKSVTFCKLANFNKNQIILNLSDGACKLLMFFIQVMSNDNCLEVNQSGLSNLFHITRKTLSKLIKELEEAGCISKIVNRSKLRGNIYIINSEISRVGNNRKADMLYNKITSQDDLDCFSDLSKPNYEVIKSKIQLDDDVIITYSSLDFK